MNLYSPNKSQCPFLQRLLKIVDKVGDEAIMLSGYFNDVMDILTIATLTGRDYSY